MAIGFRSQPAENVLGNRYFKQQICCVPGPDDCRQNWMTRRFVRDLLPINQNYNKIHEFEWQSAGPILVQICSTVYKDMNAKLIKTITNLKLNRR